MIKTFKKFKITISPFNTTNVDLLEYITELRVKKYNYNRTPHIFINLINSINPYDTRYDYEAKASNIEHTIKHSFTPYEISYYREEDILEVEDKLVTRVWIKYVEDKLKFLVLMERVKKDTNFFDWEKEYYMIINNPYWYPKNFELIKQNKITQTIFSKYKYELK